ncbi:peptide ABC transporter ATP-binding protein (plasmid) [Microvirga ossetica]|uniref:Peptide ABC transporter ATP-binding protein n=1 Tax=Microvirga ossetica TaxID=1882682 RepID=A0A1B2EVT9_9HYPH|nr:ABC transporter ATP-binding protein [Microvirga ossetica]ANY84074.1 peptide ABC transporter ATP-binding protein [Microvirga ossetica]
MNRPLLEVQGLKQYYPTGSGETATAVKAVDGVSFSIARGEVLGLVGESGSGKSTIGKAVVGLVQLTSGEIRLEGVTLAEALRNQQGSARRRVQMIFQDPYSSLNPRLRVSQILSEGPQIHGLAKNAAERGRRVRELLDLVSLPASATERYPHEFSGGQRQRIGIARALSVEPDLIVVDETVSALDVPVQAQVINLLEDLKERLGLTLLFIAHDLAVVQHVSDRVAVLYLGRVMEIASSDDLFERAHHPYTRALLSAIPRHDTPTQHSHIELTGEIPSPMSPPSGCVFRTRCAFALPACAKIRPELTEVAPGHAKACIRDDLDARDGRLGSRGTDQS